MFSSIYCENLLNCLQVEQEVLGCWLLIGKPNPRLQGSFHLIEWWPIAIFAKWILEIVHRLEIEATLGKIRDQERRVIKFLAKHTYIGIEIFL